MQHDGPILMYEAWLMDTYHYVPFKHFVDMNLPGTYVAYLLIGKFIGWGDLAFRVGDLAFLSAILLFTFLALRPLDPRAGWCAALLFGFMYLAYGGDMSLQREYLLLLPISGALAVGATSRLRPASRAFAVGFLVGMAATVKPPALVGLPPLLVFLIYSEVKESRISSWFHGALKLSAVAALGTAIPAGAMLMYLILSGGWPYFVSLYSNYAPIYLNVSKYHQWIEGPQRTTYLWAQFLEFGKHRLWLVPAIVGLASALQSRLFDSGKKAFAILLGSLAAVYCIPVVVQGRFFAYHWLVVLYFLLLLSSLCLLPQPESGPLRTWGPLVILLAVVTARVRLPYETMYQLAGRPVPVPKNGRVDAIADFLVKRLRPGDLVQPLDVTGGAVHAMLIAKAQIASPFVYDSYFYIQDSNPYVQDLRRQFIRFLVRDRPRFVIEIITNKPWVSGPGTTQSFPELRNLLRRYYVPAAEGMGSIIYERREESST